MKLEIYIPDKSRLTQTGTAVTLAHRGVSWSESQLGQKGKDRGIYVIHHQGSIKYVGKTDKSDMYFAKRLRRHFTASGSGERHIYPKLAEIKTPPPIIVSLLDLNEVNDLVQSYDFSPTPVEKCEILEQALIAAYRPEFQRSGTH